MSLRLKIDLNNVIDFKVDIDDCAETYPCQHPTTLYFKNPLLINTQVYEYNHLMSEHHICKLYKHFNLDVPRHFQEFCEEANDTDFEIVVNVK